MKKILVIYATWAGATHEIADEIARQMKTNLSGMDFDVLPVKDVTSIADYQGVVIGTSIHASQPMAGRQSIHKKASR